MDRETNLKTSKQWIAEQYFNEAKADHRLFSRILYILLTVLAWAVIAGSVKQFVDINPVKELLLGINNMVMLLLGYKWGASSGGKRKDETRASLANQGNSSQKIEANKIEQVNVTKADDITEQPAT